MTQKFESFKNLFKEMDDIIGTNDIVGGINGNKFMDENINDHDEWKKYQETDDFNKLSDEDKEKVKLFTLIMEGAEVVRQYGGEGEGDTYYTVYHFPHLDLYVQFHGWYASHIGSEFEEMFEVKPEQVTVTQYKAV